MTARAARLVLLALLAASLPAAAQDDPAPELRALFDQGHYREAAERARALGDARSLALGSSALALYGHYIATGPERRTVLEESVELAKLAKARVSGGGPERAADDRLRAMVRFHEGQALGRLAENLPQDEREAYADPVREAFEAALALDPGSWEAHAGLANWHAKVMVSADDQAGFLGAFGANLFYDASYEEAEEHRAAAAAIEKQPVERKIFLLESAELRLLIDAEDNAPAAKRDLEDSLAVPPTTAIGEVVDTRARACLEDLEACAGRLLAAVLE